MSRCPSITWPFGVSLVLVLFVPGCHPESRAQRNMDVVTRMTDAINRRDFNALNEVVAPDFHRHSGATPGLVIENREQFKDFLRQDLATVPDSDQEIELMFANDRYVAVRCMYRGTQQGPWGPFPATGKKLELPFNGILRIDEGQVAEIWVEWDNLNAMTQLGLMPSPGQDSP